MKVIAVLLGIQMLVTANSLAARGDSRSFLLLWLGIGYVLLAAFTEDIIKWRMKDDD